MNPEDTDFMGYTSINKVRRQYKKYAKANSYYIVYLKNGWL